MNNILSIKNLKKIYHTRNDEIEAINDISFDLEEGKFIAIVGSSGCGKSTLLSILCGLEKKQMAKLNLRIILRFATCSSKMHCLILGLY